MEERAAAIEAEAKAREAEVKLAQVFLNTVLCILYALSRQMGCLPKLSFKSNG